MTSNTQSVCKHCHHPIDLIDGRWHSQATCCPYNDGRHEPVAEPASTGEPQLWDCYSRESGNLLVGRIKASSADEAEGIGAREIYADKKDLAARPSEPSAPPDWFKKCVKEGPDCDCVGNCKHQPSAPQTSAERIITAPGLGVIVPLGRYNELIDAQRHVDCLKRPQESLLNTVAKYLEHGLTVSHKQSAIILCDLIAKVAEVKYVQPSAPQPVSGDALKVEEIRPRCPNCGRWNVCLRRDFDDRLYVTCGACNFEVPLNMGTIECLSPFFPLTSTAQTTPAHFSDCDYDCSCGWKKDPDSHLGAVRD